MAVDVSKIPNNNKFDPVREAILDLQGQIEDTGTTIGNGTLTINTSGGLTGSGTFTANQAGPTTITIGFASAFIELTDLSVGTPAPASGTGAIAYNNANGVFTYTPPDLSPYILSSSLDDYLYLPETGNQTMAGGLTVTGNLTVDTNTLYVDAANNRVGIGTSSPAVPLHIAGESLTEGRVQISSFAPEILFAGGLNSRIHNDSSGNLIFGTGTNSSTPTERMRISPTGNVGIGTSSPIEKLEVNGNFRLVGDSYIFNTMGTAGSLLASQIILDTTNNVDTTGWQGISFESSTAAGYGWSIGANRSSNGRSSFRFYEHISSDTGVERFTLAQDGNVGIGTSTPADKLQIDAPNSQLRLRDTDDGTFTQFSSSGNLLAIRQNSTTASHFWMNSSGDVGLGTNSPSAKLHVAGDALFKAPSTGSTTLTIEQGGAIGSARLELNSGTGSSIIDSNSPLNFNAGGSLAMTIDSSQNVGIGTSTPSYKLQVVGNVKADSFIKDGGTSTEFLKADGSVDTNTYLTTANIDLQDVTDNGATTTNSITVGGLTSTGTAYMQAANVKFIGGQSYNENIRMYAGSNDYSSLILGAVAGDSGTGDGQWTLVRYPSGANDNKFTIRHNTSDHVTILKGGSVGIGTTSPSTKLTVNGGVRLIGATGADSQLDLPVGYGALRWYDGSTFRGGIGTNSWSSVGGANDLTFYLVNGNLNISNATSPFVTFDRANERVGIGTTSPSVKLHVASTGANAYSSTITKGSNMKGIVNTLSNNADDMVGIYFATGGDTLGSHWSGITGSRSNSASNWATQLNFYTHDEAFTNLNDATQKMVIKGDGNVGIGTSSPSAPLTVRANSGGIGTRLLGRSLDGYAFHTFRNSADSATNGEIGVSDAQNMLFYTGTSERLRIDSSGNVGIGTTSPNEKLQVNGNIRIGVAGNNLLFDTTGANGSNGIRTINDYETVIFNGRGAAGFAVIGNSSIRLGFGTSYTAAQSSIYIPSTGNVGIGTSSPTNTLTVRDEGYQIAIIDESSGNISEILSSNTEMGFFADRANAIAGSTMLFSIDGSERMRINSSGNVGISNTQPSAKLHVSKNGDNGSNGLGDYGILTAAFSGQATIGAIHSGDGYANLNLGGNNVFWHISKRLSAEGHKLEYYYHNGSAFASKFEFLTDGTFKAAGGGTFVGNVGIGTTSPAEKLHVESGNIRLKSNSDGNTGILRMYDAGGTEAGQIYPASGDVKFYSPNDILFTQIGNVGIGTTSPNHKLTIDEGTGTSYVLSARNTNDNLQIKLGTTTGGYANIQCSTVSANAAYNMSIQADGGNVGIGTISALRKLTINSGASEGTLGLTSNNGTHIDMVGYGTTLDYPQARIQMTDAGFYGGHLLFLTKPNGAQTNSLSERMRIDSSGNVGIGTTTPSEKLEVKAGSSYTGHTGSAIKLTNAGYRNSELTSYSEGSYFTHYFENYTGGNGRPYDRALEIVCSGSPDGTYGEGVIKFKANPITSGVAEIMRITGSGKVGIGTTTPSVKLHVKSSSGNVFTIENDVSTLYAEQRYKANDSSGYIWKSGSAYTSYGGARAMNYYNSDSGHYFHTNSATNILNITNAGNVGIGTTSPVAKLEVGASQNSNATGVSFCAGSSVGNLVARTTTHHNWLPFTDGNNYYSAGFHIFRNESHSTEWMRITSSGDIGIGTTSPSAKLDVNGSVKITKSDTYGSGINLPFSGSQSIGMLIRNNTGVTKSAIDFYYSEAAQGPRGSIVVSSTSTAYNTTSDYRLKENVTEITDGIDRLKQLKPSRFNFIGDNRIVDGFLAHEAQEIVPEAVTGEKDGVDWEGNPQHQGIDQSKLVPLLTAALQEAVAKIELLEQRILTLENK